MNVVFSTIVENPPEIRDVVPPLADSNLLLLLLLAAGITLVLAALLIWWLHSRQQPQAMPPSAREIALLSLADLQKRAAELTAYPFAIEVSDVLRSFCQESFRLPATRQTSPEFLASVAALPQLPDGQQTALAEFLGAVDAAKFSGVEDGTFDSDRLLATARSVIEQTGSEQSVNGRDEK